MSFHDEDITAAATVSKRVVFCRDRLGTSENIVGTVGTNALESFRPTSRELVPTVPTVFSLVPSRSLQKTTGFETVTAAVISSSCAGNISAVSPDT